MTSGRGRFSIISRAPRLVTALHPKCTAGTLSTDRLDELNQRRRPSALQNQSEAKSWRRASPRSDLLERGEGPQGRICPRGSPCTAGRKCLRRAFPITVPPRNSCAGAANGTAGPGRTRENSPRTLRTEGEGERAGGRSLERGDEEGCGEEMGRRR